MEYNIQNSLPPRKRKNYNPMNPNNDFNRCIEQTGTNKKSKQREPT